MKFHADEVIFHKRRPTKIPSTTTIKIEQINLTILFGIFILSAKICAGRSETVAASPAIKKGDRIGKIYFINTRTIIPIDKSPVEYMETFSSFSFIISPGK